MAESECAWAAILPLSLSERGRTLIQGERETEREKGEEGSVGGERYSSTLAGLPR